MYTSNKTCSVYTRTMTCSVYTRAMHDVYVHVCMHMHMYMYVHVHVMQLYHNRLNAKLNNTIVLRPSPVSVPQHEANSTRT